MDKRRDKINYYLDIAEKVSERCTCLRRHYGAVIVKNDEIISTGYVGAPRGRANCTDLGYCIRKKLDIPRGERYELCRSVKRLIINAGIDKVIIRISENEYKIIPVSTWIENDESLEGTMGY